jgi:hypothetical protein
MEEKGHGQIRGIFRISAWRDSQCLGQDFNVGTPQLQLRIATHLTMTSEPNPIFLILPSFEATQFMYLLQCLTNHTPQKMFLAIFLNIIIISLFLIFNNTHVYKNV